MSENDILLDKDNEIPGNEILDNDSEGEEFVLQPKKKKLIRNPNPKNKIVVDNNFTEEIPTVNEALNEYFRLKEKFESVNRENKRKILNQNMLSKREKRAEYLKLKPKCINCKRPSRLGTIFSIKYYPADDKNDSHRVYKASCGNLADPCNLDIQINLGNVELLEESIRNVKSEITEYKNTIIDNKNKLLFGLITTETALENFENNKSYVSELSSIYEGYLNVYNNITDNQERKEQLEESLVIFYENIDKIKDCIKKMNENNDTKYATDAAEIYATIIDPIMKKIRNLKYDVNAVHNDNANNCVLIQKQFSIDKMLTSLTYEDKVIAFDVGLKSFKQKAKYTDLSEKIADEIKEEEPAEISIKIQPEVNKGPIKDEPIFGEGKSGISWKNPEYQKLWNNLPWWVTDEFKLNIDWMNQFMYKCVNDRTKPDFYGCNITTPPNIIIPPREVENGKYDFGVSVYNKVFNDLPKEKQSEYLTYYTIDPKTKVKNYDKLEDEMNKLVELKFEFPQRRYLYKLI